MQYCDNFSVNSEYQVVVNGSDKHDHCPGDGTERLYATWFFQGLGKQDVTLSCLGNNTWNIDLQVNTSKFEFIFIVTYYLDKMQTNE